MGSIVTTAELALCLLVMIAIPTGTIWAAGQYVGQRQPSIRVKWIAYLVSMLGVLYGVVHEFTVDDLHSLPSGLAVSWVVGSVIAAVIGLQEMVLYAKVRPAATGQDNPTREP